jgi:hypothetical protein
MIKTKLTKKNLESANFLLRSSNESLQKDNNVYQSENKLLKKEISKLNNVIDYYKKIVISNDIKNIQVNNQLLISHLQQENKTLNKIITDQKSHISDITDKYNQKKNEISKLQNENNVLSFKVKDLSSTIQTATNNNTLTTTANDNNNSDILLTEIKKISDKINKISNQINSKKNTNNKKQINNKFHYNDLNKKRDELLKKENKDIKDYKTLLILALYTYIPPLHNKDIIKLCLDCEHNNKIDNIVCINHNKLILRDSKTNQDVIKLNLQHDMIQVVKMCCDKMNIKNKSTFNNGFLFLDKKNNSHISSKSFSTFFKKQTKISCSKVRQTYIYEIAKKQNNKERAKIADIMRFNLGFK